MKTKKAIELIKGDIIVQHHDMKIIDIHIFEDVIHLFIEYIDTKERHNLMIDNNESFRIKE